MPKSDLNGDGKLDVGYKGYLSDETAASRTTAISIRPNATRTAGGLFSPTSTTADKTCPGSWSGDYLNYLTTSRIDALRKVLYGGLRSTTQRLRPSSSAPTYPQDGHVFGKEYQSIAA